MSVTGIGIEPTSTTQNNVTDDIFGVGYTVTKNNGQVFRWVRAEDADLTAGDCVYPADTDATKWEVTNDVSGGTRSSDTAAGIAVVACDDGNYCFIQVAGPGAVAITLNSGDFSAKESIIGDVSNDGKVKAMTAGTEDHVIGTALTASSSSSLSAGGYILHGIL